MNRVSFLRFVRLAVGVSALASAWTHRQLIGQLIKRDIQGRYRGSWGGVAWSVITPLMMLGVYTFVFSAVFPMRWPKNTAESPLYFVLILFSGLSIFSFFQEIVVKAPSLVLNQVSYVKKIIFPLDILPWVGLGSAAIHLMIALALLLLVGLVAGYPFQLTALALPVVLLPLAIGLLGLQWWFSGLGVYLRDIREPIAVATSGLLFLSPVFFPLSAVPERFQWLFYFNPMTYFVEEGRQVLLWGQLPALDMWLIALLLSITVFSTGFVVFNKLRKGFSDVI
jgi:lipopolysaccharide transport system permease protein